MPSGINEPCRACGQLVVAAAPGDHLRFYFHEKASDGEAHEKKETVDDNDGVIFLDNAVPDPSANTGQQNEHHALREIVGFFFFNDLRELRQQGNGGTNAGADSYVQGVFFHKG